MCKFVHYEVQTPTRTPDTTRARARHYKKICIQQQSLWGTLVWTVAALLNTDGYCGSWNRRRRHYKKISQYRQTTWGNWYRTAAAQLLKHARTKLLTTKPSNWKLIDNPTTLFTVSLKLQKPQSRTEPPTHRHGRRNSHNEIASTLSVCDSLSFSHLSQHHILSSTLQVLYLLPLYFSLLLLYWVA
jgi:hypothetical protein